jgi:hypothetical protein
LVKWTEVKGSDAHRQPGHWVKGYWMQYGEAHRNKTHKRRHRRTDEQIQAATLRKTKTKKKSHP